MSQILRLLLVIAAAAPSSTAIAVPLGQWSDYPECDLQYEQDTLYCNRFSKARDAAKCRAIRSERLAYCNKTQGQTGHPRRPLLKDD